MTESVEGGFDQKILMAGDSRLKRLRNLPCESLPLHSIDFIIVNGMQIEDLIEKVDEQLSPDHITLILMAFLGDSTCLTNHTISEKSSVTLVSCREGQPAARVLELAAVAHQRWQESRPERKIIWTLPYYLDIVTHNNFRFQAPLSPEFRELSISTSQKFVYFVGQLQNKWLRLMPKNTWYRHLNEVLFHGSIGRELLKTFIFEGRHFMFPVDLLNDGIHPSPRLTDMIWKCLVRAIKAPVNAPSNPVLPFTPSNPVPSLAKLSVKERLDFSPSTSNQPRGQASMWKGKGQGKGKRTTPYTSGGQAPRKSKNWQYHSGTQKMQSYASAPIPPQSGGRWGPPPYYGPSTPTAAPYSSAMPSQTPMAPRQQQRKATFPPIPKSELLEETTDTYGNITWRPLPAEPISRLGTINYTSPQVWNWDAHLAEVNRVQGRCITNSLGHQSNFREQAANIIRERALEEMRRGWNSSVNHAASTLAHRTVYQFSSPEPGSSDIHSDLRHLMPPPS